MTPESKTESILAQAERIRDELLIVRKETKNTLQNLQERSHEKLKKRLNLFDQAAVKSDELVDTRIVKKTPVIYPEALTAALPLNKGSANTTLEGRENIINILNGKDDRLIVVIGPCSIHDGAAALQYADWINQKRTKYGDKLEIIMRAYMEKPRSETGWKGFTYDPKLDNSNDINLGLILTRLVASRITKKGVPIAVERLNALTPQYLNGLVAYDVIGARNTIDQKAREYASGTSSPICFKNTPDGNIENAVQAAVSAIAPHDFLGINSLGLPMQVTTKGNHSAHVVLRGGSDGPNYSSRHIKRTLQIIRSKNQKLKDGETQLLEAIVIDASHGNSAKNPDKHREIITDVADQIVGGEPAIKGVMIESNVVGGRQNFEAGQNDPKKLVYGQSITDSCSSLEETETMLQILSEAVA